MGRLIFGFGESYLAVRIGTRFLWFIISFNYFKILAIRQTGR